MRSKDGRKRGTDKHPCGIAMIIAMVVAAMVTTVRPAMADLVGKTWIYVPSAEDTFVELALRFNVGYTELVAANPDIDPWLPAPGIPVVVPSRHLLPTGPREGIVINLPEQRLYFFPGDGPPITYPIGIGVDDADLFTGRTRVVRKRENPTWVPTPSMRAASPNLPASVPPGPENPLGAFALDLERRYIVIHGTNRPYGIGRRVSQGCFRLYPWDIEALFPRVAVGTPVTVTDQAIKVGWHENRLYLEVHPPLNRLSILENSERISDPPEIDKVRELVVAAAGKHGDLVDWTAVERIATQRLGIPYPILAPDRLDFGNWRDETGGLLQKAEERE